MTIPRNPFKLRASEQATSHEDFLTLFSPKVLDLLPKDEIWDRLIIFASAPGAGKTTLLRLFTPGPLRLLHEARSIDENRDVIQRLESLGALTHHGPNVIGVLISCREQYPAIEDLPLDEATRLRWFFGLLDARIVLLTLRAVLTLTGRAYPQDVSDLEVCPRGTAVGSSRGESISGKQLYEQARQREAQITGALDSLRALDTIEPLGRSRLESLRLFTDSDVFVDGAKAGEKLLVMFDDVHALDATQRRMLRDDLEHRDLGVARWMAERYQAVGPSDLVTSARTEGRDYRHVLTFEEWARSASFPKVVLDVADRRSRRAEVQFNSFASCLASTISRNGERDRANKALESSRSLALRAAAGAERFRDWIRATEEAVGPIYERAVRWRALAIIVERQLRRQQLAFDIPLEAGELERREDSGVDSAARLFLAQEHRLPYYFGSECLARLASMNIEQFLELAGELFDKVLAQEALSMGQRRLLTSSVQDTLIRAMSERRLEALPRDVPHGQDVQQLVKAIGSLCNDETYRETAPYAPGATGVAISMRDREILVADGPRGQDVRLTRLFYALTSAIAHNVLEARPDTRVKGGNWLVLYLNRIYCPNFGLPLQYGGFRERPLRELKTWLDEGYRARPQAQLPPKQ